MNGKVVAGGIVLTGLVAGVVMYWLQVYAFYEPVVFAPGAEILLTPAGGAAPEAIAVADLQGIDAESSPLRFRACFTTPLSLESLNATFQAYEAAEPTLAPAWFDCFDAATIDKALASGEARAFLSQASIRPQVDRVVAVFPDGRAYAWHQLQPAAE